MRIVGLFGDGFGAEIVSVTIVWLNTIFDDDSSESVSISKSSGIVGVFGDGSIAHIASSNDILLRRVSVYEQ